jgi:hypothetical protein
MYLQGSCDRTYVSRCYAFLIKLTHEVSMLEIERETFQPLVAALQVISSSHVYHNIPA